jgi:hypothetical protein
MTTTGWYSASSPASTAVTDTASTILEANSGRNELIIANIGTTTIYLCFGQTPTTSAYHVPLAPCATANDGTGGILISDVWKGDVQAIAVSSGTVSVTELS